MPAFAATKDSAFYNSKLRNMFTAWSNVAGDVTNDLNDMVATLIGMVRDDVPFNQVLSADIIYTFKEDMEDIFVQPRNNPLEDGSNCAAAGNRFIAYSPINNQHHGCLQHNDLKENLERKKQSELSSQNARAPGAEPFPPQVQLSFPLPDNAIAGIISTRAFGKAFFSAGTNRRATAFVLKNFLCRPIESLSDTSLIESYIRQDVDREAGIGEDGEEEEEDDDDDNTLFKRKCKGCHAGMDAISGWTVYYDYRDTNTDLNAGVHYANTVGEKITRNVIDGYGQQAPSDNSFVNLWTKGQNADVGWGEKSSGKGARDFGEMITETKAFATCLASQVYHSVCFTEPQTQDSKVLAAINKIAASFAKDDEYNMRKMFVDTAMSCLVEEQNTEG